MIILARSEKSERRAMRERLRRLDPLALCGDAELDSVARLLTPAECAPETELLVEGRLGGQFFLIEDGWARVTRGEVEIARVGPGDFAGEMSLMAGARCEASVTAVTPMRLRVLAGHDFSELLDEVPALREKLRATAAARSEQNRPLPPPERRRARPLPKPDPRPRPALPLVSEAARAAGERRRRRRRRLTAAAMVVGLVGSCGGIFVLTQRDRATPIDLATALRSFRHARPLSRGLDPSQAGGAGAPGAGAGQGPTAGAAAAPAGPGTGDPAAAAVAVHPVPPGPAGPAPAAATTAGAAFVAPAEGVYVYDTTGGESISMFGARHDYPAQSYASVHRLAGGAWQMDVTVVKEHVDHYTFGAEPGRDVESAQGREVTFFGQTDGATYSADPPALLADAAAVPGSATEAVFRGADGSTARSRIVSVGRQEISVGGTAVDTYAITLDSVMSGKASGSEHDQVWLDPTTGLIVKLHRDIDTQAHAVFGNVRYIEHATFSLHSRTPNT